MHRVLALLLILLPLAGCKKPMALPAMFEAGVVEPFDQATNTAHPNQLDIFYATDRRFERRDNGTIRYNRQRSDRLSVGRARLRFGDEGDWAKILAEVRDQPGGERYVPDLLGISRFGTLDQQMRPDGRPGLWLDETTPAAQNLVHALSASLDQSPGKAITIYFHGFNSSFKQAARITAEYDLYTGGLGPFILYAWPSYDSLFEYSHDRDSVRYTSSNARRLIAFLADRINAGELDAEQIHLIAHSTGAEIVGSVLRELALLTHRMTPAERLERWRIGSVLLIAPDVSIDVARERLLKEDVAGMFRQIVVYSSADDRALRWASRILYRIDRIGSIGECDLSDIDRDWLSRSKGIALVDVDSDNTYSFIKHSHHRHSPAVASDMILSLRTGLGPAERGLVRKDGHVFWRFPEDHTQRVTDAAIKAYGTTSTTAEQTQPAD